MKRIDGKHSEHMSTIYEYVRKQRDNCTAYARKENIILSDDDDVDDVNMALCRILSVVIKYSMHFDR